MFKALAVLSAIAAAGTVWLGYGGEPAAPGPRTVHVPAGEIAYRPEGNFHLDGKAATPVLQRVTVPGFDVMEGQVTQADYARCVAAGACETTQVMGAGNAPQTHLSWYDATAYAAWLGQTTGAPWRLPTDREWQRLAAEAFGEVAPEIDGQDPGQRMLARYEAGLLLRGRADLSAGRESGRNSLGLIGVSDAVWEWTDGCMANGTLDAGGRILEMQPYCTVRSVGGQHRALVLDFIRDASVGGCAAGLPPDYLGLRLVRG